MNLPNRCVTGAFVRYLIGTDQNESVYRLCEITSTSCGPDLVISDLSQTNRCWTRSCQAVQSQRQTRQPTIGTQAWEVGQALHHGQDIKFACATGVHLSWRIPIILANVFAFNSASMIATSRLLTMRSSLLPRRDSSRRSMLKSRNYQNNRYPR